MEEIVPHYNPFPNDKFYTLPNSKTLQTTILNWTKMAKGNPKEWKTLWEKENLLITSKFSFSHSVFKRPVLHTRKNKSLFGRGLNTCTCIYLFPLMFFEGYVTACKFFFLTLDLQVRLNLNISPLPHNSMSKDTRHKSS